MQDMTVSIRTLPLLVMIGYYLLTNLVLFCAMWLDKRRAEKNKWRIQESTLFLLAVLGGGIGGLIGMFRFRHKTKHISFLLVYTLTTILHIALFIFLLGKLVTF